jgi:hypothetical protein
MVGILAQNAEHPGRRGKSMPPRAHRGLADLDTVPVDESQLVVEVDDD